MADTTDTAGGKGSRAGRGSGAGDGLTPAGRALLEIGGGAAAGAILGRIVGRGLAGAAIGAAAGAMAATAISLEAAGRAAAAETAVYGEEAGRRPGAGGRIRGEPAPGQARGDRASGRRARRAEYESWTKARLYDRAKELDIPGRSRMTKAELIAALFSRGAPLSRE